jgi:WD40 repeat protein
MPDGRSLLAAGADGFVHCIDLQAAQETRRFDWRIGRVRAVAVSSDGLTCAAGGENGQVVVWDVDT